MKRWAPLFPPVNTHYRGSAAAFWLFVLIAVAGTVRSLIHLFAADGGAGSIAGIDVGVVGGGNLIALFAQWGASQLLLALLYWLAILRYRFLIPAMLATIVAEQALRILAGQLKPLTVAAPPPGAIGSYLLLPLAAVALLLSLRERRR